jgi:hypothetical protein
VNPQLQSSPSIKLSIFSSHADNPYNPFSPHCGGEKVRMRGSSFVLARMQLRGNLKALTGPSARSQ